MKNPFHLAIPVNNLSKASDFYQNILECKRGRESDSWIDFNLFGHQLVCHYVEDAQKEIAAIEEASTTTYELPPFDMIG